MHVKKVYKNEASTDTSGLPHADAWLAKTTIDSTDAKAPLRGRAYYPNLQMLAPLGKKPELAFFMEYPKDPDAFSASLKVIRTRLSRFFGAEMHTREDGSVGIYFGHHIRLWPLVAEAVPGGGVDAWVLPAGIVVTRAVMADNCDEIFRILNEYTPEGTVIDSGWFE